MPKTRPPYPPQFRLEAVRLLRSGVRTPRQLAEEFGCSAQTLRKEHADRGEREDVLSSDDRRGAAPGAGDPEAGSGAINSSAQHRFGSRAGGVALARRRREYSVQERRELWDGGKRASRSVRSAGRSMERPAPSIARSASTAACRHARRCPSRLALALECSNRRVAGRS